MCSQPGPKVQSGFGPTKLILNVLQPRGKFANKCKVAPGNAPRVFCFTGNVAVLNRVFALQVSLLAQGLNAGYRHQPTLVYALSLFTAFEITGGNVVADLPSITCRMRAA